MKKIFYLLLAPLCFIFIPVHGDEFKHAKLEYCKFYSDFDAHLLFAAYLYDRGFTEAAFFNLENILRSSTSGEIPDFFNKYIRRELKPLLPPADTTQISIAPPEKRSAMQRAALHNAARTSPAAAHYLRFALASEKLWNSTAPADISAVTALIGDADRDLKDIYEFNLAAAEYFRVTAKNDDAALKYYYRLYFHSPENRYSFQIRYLFRRMANRRLTGALRRYRNDPDKLVRAYMDSQPRMVEDFLRSRKKQLPIAVYLRCCLAVCDSPDLQLRSFAFAELLRSDLSSCHHLAGGLLNSPDPARRAIAAVFLPDMLPPDNLPAALAELGNDEYAIVRMTADAIASSRCSQAVFAAYQKLLKVRK